MLRLKTRTYNAVNSEHMTVMFLCCEVTGDVCKYGQVITILTCTKYVVDVVLTDNFLHTNTPLILSNHNTNKPLINAPINTPL